MTTDKTWLGKTSLWSSIVGVILPGCLLILVWLVHIPYGSHLDFGPMVLVMGGVSCSGLVFVILEFVALGCGMRPDTRRREKQDWSFQASCSAWLPSPS
jgi:hypothetical protein